MNPICLLTPARTYKEMADRPGAYKLLAKTASLKRPGKRPVQRRMENDGPAQKSLFERIPEPVKAVELEEPAPAPAVAPASIPEPVAVAVPVLREAAPEVLKTAGKPAAIAPAEAEAPAANPFNGAQQPTPARRAARVCKVWMDHLAFWRKHGSGGAASIQGELALEKVTVLKNDLNEDDLEVVLVERKVGTGEKPLARLSKMEVPSEAWTWLTTAFHKKKGASVFSPKEEAEKAPDSNARAPQE